MAERRSPEWHANVSRGVRRELARRRARERVRPSDLLRLERSGVAAASLRPQLEHAEREADALVAALGGADQVSEQRLLLAQDFAWLGVVMRGLIWRYAESLDPEVASRISTLASARRAHLIALGLDRVAKELDLEDYLATSKRQNGAGATIANEPGSEVEDAEIVAHAANGDGPKTA